MRLLKVLAALCVLALALLLMSALVVCSAPADAPAPADSMPVKAIIMPAALPAQETGISSDAAAASPRAIGAVIACVLLCVPLMPICRDANGRVLCAARYENSFYQLFRPEVAGG